MIQTQFFNWSNSGMNPLSPPWNICSPNLALIRSHITIRMGGGYSVGCHGDRPIRGGTLPSAHAYGSAFDWRYEPASATSLAVPRKAIVEYLLPWLIKHSAELHIDAIHDYYGDRIWRAGRTPNIDEAYTLWWKKQYGAGEGMGESWATYLHIETHRQGWSDTAPIANRIAVPTLIYDAPPYEPDYLCLNCPVDQDRTRWLQTILNQWFGATLTVDGSFGPATEAAVKAMQVTLRVIVDGIYGRQTATVLDTWLEARRPV